MIASYVINKLNTVEMTNFTRIRLVSDGCGGQNKNLTVVAMTYVRLRSNETSNHIEKVEVDFLVNGHRFLPANHIFSFI